MQTEKHIPQSNPFKVPDGYFEELKNNIQNECYQEKTSLFDLFQWQTIVPTTAIISFLFIGIPSFTSSSQALSDTELYAAVEAEIIDWDESLIYDFAYMEETNEAIEYLLEEEIDLSILINEL